MTKNKLSIIIPVYNEEEDIVKNLKKINHELLKLSSDIGLFVVNDGSTDNTQALLTKLNNKLNFFLINQKNTGYGGAIKIGAKKAFEKGYNYGLFMDSDLTNPPEFIKDFSFLIPHGYDIIKADRFLKLSDMSEVPVKRRILSIISNLVASLCFRLGIKDYTNGFRAIKLKTFLSMNLKENGFPIILEEMYYVKKLNLKLINIKTHLKSRLEDSKKSSFNYDFKTLSKYLKYCFMSIV